MKNVFKGKQFDKVIIIEAVGLYCRFSLSYREVAEILRHRGISLNPTTIMRWVHEYSKILYVIWKKKQKQRTDSWRMDETYVKIKGVEHYLYRAVDSQGNTLDFCLRKKRNHKSAMVFLTKLIKQYGEPRALVSDKNPAIICAIKKLHKKKLLRKTEYRKVKYLNNIIEQDHRQVKKRFPKSLGFQKIQTASATIKGIEVVNALYKESRRTISLFDFSVWTEIEALLGVA